MGLNGRKVYSKTEVLVLDIVRFLLGRGGSGYSNEISDHIVEQSPRNYSTREVVGILRNRPMFRHAQTSERKGGIRWRLDVLTLEKYLANKEYQEIAADRDIYSMIENLKWQQLRRTLDVLDSMDPQDISSCYEKLVEIWA